MQRIYDEELLAHVFRQPQWMFVLWAIETGFCSHVEDFERHFGAQLPARSIVPTLQYLGFLRRDGGSLALTEMAAWLVSDLGSMEEKRRVLVIDDRAALLGLLRRLLEDERYEVSVLQEGSAAVREIRGNPPDLVILDLELTDVDGVDILRDLRASPATMDIPVIVYASGASKAKEVESMIAGDRARYRQMAVMGKPLDVETLLLLVWDFTGGSSPAADLRPTQTAHAGDQTT